VDRQEAQRLDGGADAALEDGYPPNAALGVGNIDQGGATRNVVGERRGEGSVI
jgi:hypothetical protein